MPFLRADRPSHGVLRSATGRARGGRNVLCSRPRFATSASPTAAIRWLRALCKFLEVTRDGAARDHACLRGVDLLAVYKSLVTSAVLIMPEPELAYFTDTIEWLNNPDHEYDAGLFAGTCCHVYDARV